MEVIIVFVILVGVYAWFHKVASPQEENKEQLEDVDVAIRMVDEPEDYLDGSYPTYITGLKHYITNRNIGVFEGIVIAEPNNEYNKKAMAIYIDGGIKVGYIPDKELCEFRKWNNGLTWPCIGYIQSDPEYGFKGSIKILKPYNEQYIKTEKISYLNWAIGKFGKEFIPTSLIDKYELK